MTDSFTSTAAAVSTAQASPTVIWSLVSSAAGVTAASITPYELNILGEIAKIPYFDLGVPLSVPQSY
jgi:hypothetical protein